jgi:hypothetical protein
MKISILLRICILLFTLMLFSCGGSNPNSKTEEIASDDSNEEDEYKQNKNKKKNLSKKELIIGTWETFIKARKIKILFKNGGRISSVSYEDGQIIHKVTGKYEIIDSELIITNDESPEESYAEKIISISNEKLVIYDEDIGKIVYWRID